MRFRRQPPVGENGVRTRETNVAFANALIETEIAQRNARKGTRRNTARGVIVTAGLVLTLLLGLANDAGVFSSKASIVARIALVATVLLGAGSAACAIGTLGAVSTTVWQGGARRLQPERVPRPAQPMGHRHGRGDTHRDREDDGSAARGEGKVAEVVLCAAGVGVHGADRPGGRARARSAPPKTTPPVRILIQQR